MRRLPVYLLVDVSGSMSGEPIEAVKNGLGMLVGALRRDPQALEVAYLSVISFGSKARQVVPLTDLASFQLPEISAGGATALGDALSLLCRCRENEVVKTTKERKGDWRPMVFILTDGVPTDEPKVGMDAFHAMKWGVAVSCAAGARADVAFLETVTPGCVVKLDTADQASLSAFFKWVSSSVASNSKSINETGQTVAGIEQLPPPPPEVIIV